MNTNASSVVILTFESLGLSNASIYPMFLLATLTYLLIMLSNLMVLTGIAWSKKLHKPMFILLFNLPISDMVGATAFFPQLIFGIVTQNRLISHPGCITQAFLVHIYGTGNLLILSAMAYDRYIAICHPLRYNAIMSPHSLVRIIVLIWLINVTLIGTLILMLTRFQICRTNLVDMYCNNPSLLKLICDDTSINNYYGMFTIVIVLGGSLSVVLYTYAQILRTCVMTNQSDARRKALQTCGTHLVVYIFLQTNTLVTLIAHRFHNVSPFLRRALGMSVLVFPPLLDPIIYGFKTKELRQSIKVFLQRNVVSTKW